jgi:hypothetical protein
MKNVPANGLVIQLVLILKSTAEIRPTTVLRLFSVLDNKKRGITL